MFLDYYDNNEVDVRILKDKLSEEEAFELERIVTEKYKNLGQCFCCLVQGGTGGKSSIWTKEFKQYWSEHNPMKEED